MFLKLTDIELNFLSHYFFERFAHDSNQVLGCLLPDFLKNVDKSYQIHIQKFEDRLEFHPQASAITMGWNRHIEVDRLFHGSDFFYTHTHKLRRLLVDVIDDMPIRPSFLAHIGLELLLDHILIEQELVSVERMYDHLENINKQVVSAYLKILDVNEERFFRFFDHFVQSTYTFDYAEIEKLPIVLFNICKRVWDFDYSEKHVSALGKCLIQFKESEMSDFWQIYTMISDRI